MRTPKALIADDDHDLVDILTKRCQALGLEVDSAYNAMTALGKIEEEEPDVVILDVNMPLGNGLSVCEMMASHERLSKIPVIMLTGEKDPETIHRCHDMSAYYVSKCQDVWPRIEPLLIEFFGQEPSVADREADLSDVCEAVLDAVPSDEADHQAPDEAAGEATSDQWLEMVFAAIGQDSNYLALPEGQESPQPVARPWVLCIDDDSDFSFGLKLRLEQHGVDVLRAFAGMEGFRCAFVSQAQAIVLDYEMPDGNGDYVLGRLKDNPVTKDIPVIVLTGRRDRALERKMYNLGAARFLTKPIDWELLWSELQQHLEPCAAGVG